MCSRGCVTHDHPLFVDCKMNNSFDSVKELHSVNDGVSAVDVDHVQRFNRFYHIDLSAKWVVGPLTKRFIRAQHLWAEMKLWRVFDKLKAAGGGLRSNLVTFEVRLACYWHFGLMWETVERSPEPRKLPAWRACGYVFCV